MEVHLQAKWRRLPGCLSPVPASKVSRVLDVYAGSCGVLLEKMQLKASVDAEGSNMTQSWAPDWLSAVAAEERSVHYKMDVAPLMRALLVQQVQHCLLPHCFTDVFGLLWPWTCDLANEANSCLLLDQTGTI